MSTAISTSITTSAASLATLQVHSIGPSGNISAFTRVFNALWGNRRRSGVSTPSLVILRNLPCPDLPSAAERGADLAQRLADVRSARLRPFVPIGLHGVDRAGDLFGLRVGEGIARGAQHLHGFRLLL